MTIKDYYKKLAKMKPAIEFREKVMEECEISYCSFYVYLNNPKKTPILIKKKMAEIANMPVEELFKS